MNERKKRSSLWSSAVKVAGEVRRNEPSLGSFLKRKRKTTNCDTWNYLGIGININIELDRDFCCILPGVAPLSMSHLGARWLNRVGSSDHHEKSSGLAHWQENLGINLACSGHAFDHSTTRAVMK